MSSYLVALIWPVGMVAIFGAAYLATRGEHRPTGESAPSREAGRHQSRRAPGGSALAEVAAGSGRFAVVALRELRGNA